MGLGVASALSPELAARFAEQIFLTPRRLDPGADEPTLWRRATPFPIAVGDHLLVGWSWGEGPAVLLVHGWGGRATQLAPMIPPLLEGGMRVIAFDAIAHGASPGRQTTLVELARTIAATEEATDGLRGILAHSFGAAATTVALGLGLQTQRVAYIAPMFSVERAVERFTTRLGLGAAATAAFRRRLQARTGMAVEQLDGSVLAPMMTAKLVVVHDRFDRELPAAEGAALAHAWPGAALVETEGLGHRRILGDPGVVRTVTDFLVGSPAFSARPTFQESIELELFHRSDRPIPPGTGSHGSTPRDRE